MKETKPSRKQAKLAKFLQNELTALDTAPVNPYSDETMGRAAPDTYWTIRTYLERRLAQIAKAPTDGK